MNHQQRAFQEAFMTTSAHPGVYPTGEQLYAARGISLGTRALLAELEAVQQMDDFPKREEVAQELQEGILHALKAQGILRKEPATEP